MFDLWMDRNIEQWSVKKDKELEQLNKRQEIKERQLQWEEHSSRKKESVIEIIHSENLTGKRPLEHLCVR